MLCSAVARFTYILEKVLYEQKNFSLKKKKRCIFYVCVCELYVTWVQTPSKSRREITSPGSGVKGPVWVPQHVCWEQDPTVPVRVASELNCGALSGLWALPPHSGMVFYYRTLGSTVRPVLWAYRNEYDTVPFPGRRWKRPFFKRRTTIEKLWLQSWPWFLRPP